MSLEACGPNGFNISGRRNATCRWKPADRTDSIFQGVATRHVAGSLRTERIQYFRASQCDMSLEACGPKVSMFQGVATRHVNLLGNINKCNWSIVLLCVNRSEERCVGHC